MTALLPDFGKIRAIGGRQDRAFEELAYQLLTSSVDRDAARLVRTGDPDGGLEWYIEYPDGRVEGWQAKYITDIDVLLGAATKSVKTVAEKRPEVDKMTFVIPWNLPDGRPSRGKSARTKYDDKVKSWQKSVEGADRIEFDLVGETELLNLLALPEHRGRQLFFWGQNVLSHAHLAQSHATAVDVAGERYRPDLQVDVPIQEEIDALGLGGQLVDQIDVLVSGIAAKTENDRHLPDGFEDDSRSILAGCNQVVACWANRTDSTATIQQEMTDLQTQVTGAEEAVAKLTGSAHELDDEWRRTIEASKGSPNTPRAESPLERTYALRKLAGPLRELKRLLDSSPAELRGGQPYFLQGAAGSGKTHLLLDAAQRALDEGRPAVVLLGEWFGDGELWSQLASNLGLPTNLSGPEVLATLEACGALNGDGRLLLAIDALNESGGGDFWRANLPRLLAEVSRYPHIGVAVSVRSTYLEQIDPDGRIAGRSVARVHPGLAGREVEALSLYFQHYGLEQPRFPLLNPEFTNPLFLQFYCEAYSEADAKGDVHEGRLQVFDRVVEARLKKIAVQVADSGASLGISLKIRAARAVLDAVLAEMASSGSERLTLDTVGEIVSRLTVEYPLAESLLARLEAEGVFASEEMWVDGEVQPGLRLTFQAFSDHLILSYRIRRRDEAIPLVEDENFHSWLGAASWGIQEAAAVLLPERHGVELRDYLDAPLSEDDPERGERELDRFDRLTVETLPFRTPSSVTDATIDAVNRYLRSEWARPSDFFDVLALVAPMPEHPLNGDGLHDHLSRQEMAARDASFGIATYNTLDEKRALWRLASWAIRGPYPDYDPEVVRLATIPLVWLLSSPNRYMRDWLTKVLVKLLAGHIDVLIQLMRDFAKVDDLYVRERLAGIGYGVLMRNQGADPELLRPLVLEASSISLTRPAADALLLDHLEGVVEFGLAKGLIEPGDVPNHKVPYGFPRPDHPWTMERIDKHKDAYSQIYYSLFHMGDFGRYEVDVCFGKFTTVPLSEPAPPRSTYVHKVDEKKMARIRAKADPEVLAELDSLGASGLPALEKLIARVDHESEAARELRSELAACRYTVQEPDVDYPTERARRWIYMKSVKLGWTEERFGDFEDIYIRHDGRSAAKPERFGKKYQWIAYRELLARVRDNLHPKQTDWSDAENEFPGLWDTYDRDIDPSVPPIADYDALEQDRGRDDETFGPPPVRVSLEELPDRELDRYLTNGIDPLEDFASHPRASASLVLVDQAANEWFLFDTFAKSRVDDDELEFGMSIDQASSVCAWLIPAEGAEAGAQGVVKDGPNLRTRLHDISFGNGHVDCCYVGEIGWRNQGCHHHHRGFVEFERDGDTHRYMPLVEEYLWESGRYDCSITDACRTMGLSDGIAGLGGAYWDGDLSWVVRGGLVVASDVGFRGFDGISGFVVRRDWLLGLMAEHSLSLIVRRWTERRDFRPRPSRKFSQSNSVALVDASGSVVFEEQTVGEVD